MQIFHSVAMALLFTPKARREMAFSAGDKIRVEAHGDKGYAIAMYSGTSGAFCGYY